MNVAYHFKTERAVYHEQYEIIDFPNVNHIIDSDDKDGLFSLPLTSTVIGPFASFKICFE